MGHCTLSRNTTPYHITSHHIISHHITSHHITPHHITSHHITPHHITSHHITSYHIISHYITSHHTTSHHIIPHHIIPHPITSGHLLHSLPPTHPTLCALTPPDPPRLRRGQKLPRKKDQKSRERYGSIDGRNHTVHSRRRNDVS